MKRKDFLKMCGLLGVGVSLQATLSSCNDDDNVVNPTEKVIIIGAGAAGLSAGYLLDQQGIDFQILEASSNYGGRIKRNKDFADFPIPLGGEWLHVERGVLDEIINNPSVQPNVETTFYDQDADYALVEGMRLSIADVDFVSDQKFINSTWLDFYDQHIVPSVEANISLNQVVTAVDYSGDQVVVRTAGEEYVGTRVIVTVPVKMLQKGSIAFIPELPENKLDAIKDVTVWDGCKAFIEFSEKFYPALTGFTILPESAGQKLYYDAAYGQNTNQHILGLFAVGTGTQPYLQLDGDELINYMLNELDDIFNGQASPNYVKHIFQNWNEEPFIEGAYINDFEDWNKVQTLGEAVGHKLFFAGTSYTTGSDWSSVHTAARSAKRAVEKIAG